MSAQFA